MSAASNKRRLLLLLAAAAAASAGLVAGSQSFLRPSACAPGAVGVAVNFSTAVGSLAECALRCSSLGWCAALLMGQSGCCDCALIDWKLLYGVWLGQGDCPDGLFVKEGGPPAELLQFSSCQQVDVLFNAICNRAIDGKTNQDFHANSCTHTARHNYSWWRASLVQRAFVERVALYNRGDDASFRLNNFTISLDGIVFASYFEASFFSVRNFSCGRAGQTVQVDLYNMNDGVLTLCEVVAYGRRFP